MSRTIPGITLEDRITRTNLSEIWRGRRVANGAPVAVKFALSPAAAAELKPEADTVNWLGALGVPGIVPAEFSDNPEPHLVLPWKGPRTFRHVLEEIRDADDRARAARILHSVIETVASVHRQGFLHGDLKPENILVDDQGRPWLTDFGMARAIRQTRLDSELSRSCDDNDGGAWGGTLLYLPPEGLHGDPPTFSSDVYAIGVMLHEVLLGKRPDRAATPESLRALLPSAVVDVLIAALAWAPRDRISTAPWLLSLLEPLRSELTYTGPARWARRAVRLALNGLAAFFVAFRYASVLALLAAYGLIGVKSLVENSAWALLGVLFVLLHLYIRWEGPESREEATLRAQGRVLSQ